MSTSTDVTAKAAPYVATQIKRGRLAWLLRTAMPLRNDFKLYLDGEWLRPTKLDQKPVKRWVLGKDLDNPGDPAPEELKSFKRSKQPEGKRYGFTHPQLGEITGFAEVYDNILTEHIDRSHGFFVYVRGRLINPFDSHFGISANQLRHGTFGRFRMVVNIDALDEELRSSRESVRDTQMKQLAQDVLHGVFNFARNFLTQHDATENPGFRAALRIAQTPGSLTNRPLIGLFESAVRGEASPKLLQYPTDLSKPEALKIVQALKAKAESEPGLECTIRHQDLSPNAGIAMFDPQSDILYINMLHPFVAAYRGDFERDDTLNLLCMAEVLTESYLYNIGLEDSQVDDVLAMRDELLRQLARSMRRTANVVARDLIDSSTDQRRFEVELAEAFNSLGFETVHVGGKGKPDGLATAFLAATGGKKMQYKLSLEAKSKEVPGKKVEQLNIARIASHRDKNGCDHAVIVGADFSLSEKDSAPVDDARRNKAQTGRSLTLIRVHDLAKLVRLRAIKHIGLDRIHSLFDTCISPKESADWIENLAAEHREKPPLRAILETIWDLQKEVPAEAVEFAAVKTALRMKKQIDLSKPEIIQLCKSMEQMVPEVVVRKNAVELNQKPDNIIKTAEATLKDFPEAEQRLAFKW
jgi:hypothetical protein